MTFFTTLFRSRGSAYNAFDNDSATKVFGGTSRSDADIRWEDEGSVYSASSVNITIDNSGTTLSLYGRVADSGDYESIYSDAVNVGENEYQFEPTEAKYDGLSFRITGGSTTNTPSIVEAQVYGTKTTD